MDLIQHPSNEIWRDSLDWSRDQRPAQKGIPISLYIDRTFNIYVIKEGKRYKLTFTPLMKSLYFLYLRYPEGIARYQLPDYEEEIKAIYFSLSNLSMKEKQDRSIEFLLNRWDNSFNEKCTRIKQQFRPILSREELELFIIAGQRREKKAIRLAPERIYWEKPIL